ncbi:MAG: YggS family pyridoxal phosphate-dependent enzyme [Chloroflexi bacterium]|nr:MAG: YggS family pyridoxal phosphate-dependent enzyme [Chloroflexota bacterium]
MTDIEANLRDVQRRIAKAAGRAGRDPAEITLVAVTKTLTVDHILTAYKLGVRHIGENRVHEAAEKIPVVSQWLEERGFSPITWHMVGHLQSRKARDAIRLFDLIHSVDTLKLARRLDRLLSSSPPGLGGKEGGREGKVMPILLEANVSGEESKYGFALDRWEEDREQRESFFGIVEEILTLPHVEVWGLMTMAPIVADPEEARPYFRSLRRLRDALAERFPGEHWQHLSMGMTDDFEVAIEEGATMVRIGRAIFGERRI